jgi:hypothetical protein
VSVTTTSLTPIGTAGPKDPDALVWYSDMRFGFTVALPADWSEVPGSRLAGHDPITFHLASFAAVDGPAHLDTFLDGIDVDILVGSQSEDPAPELMRESLQHALDDGPAEYDYFKVLEPIHEVQVGEVSGLAATVRFAWEQRVMVKSLYLCIANHCLYQIGLQADDAHWAAYQSLFEEIIESFSFGPDSG